MIVALLALFVALGGVSYAAAVVLPAASVGTVQLKNNAVSNPKVKANAITSAKVLNHSLLAVDFKLGQIPQGPPGAPGAAGPAGPPGISGLTIVTGNTNTGTGDHTSDATCPSGKKAISGGWTTSSVSSTVSIIVAQVLTDGNTYEVKGQYGSGSDSWTLTANVLCATVAA